MLGLISSSLIENSVGHSIKQIGPFNSNFSRVHHHHECTQFGLPRLAHHRHGGSMLISFEGFGGLEESQWCRFFEGWLWLGFGREHKLLQFHDSNPTGISCSLAISIHGLFRLLWIQWSICWNQDDLLIHVCSNYFLNFEML